jgi:hypothetical protein
MVIKQIATMLAPGKDLQIFRSPNSEADDEIY